MKILLEMKNWKYKCTGEKRIEFHTNFVMLSTPTAAIIFGLFSFEFIFMQIYVENTPFAYTAAAFILAEVLANALSMELSDEEENVIDLIQLRIFPFHFRMWMF